MIKFRVQIKKNNLINGFRANINYLVLAVDKDNFLLGDNISRAICWFHLDHLDFAGETE